MLINKNTILLAIATLFCSSLPTYTMELLTDPKFQQKMVEQKKAKEKKKKDEVKVQNHLFKPTKLQKQKKEKKSKKTKKEEVTTVANPLFFNDRVPAPTRMLQLKERNPQVSLDSKQLENKQLEKAKLLEERRRSNSVDSVSIFPQKTDMPVAQITEPQAYVKQITDTQIEQLPKKEKLTITDAIRLQKKKNDDKAPKLTKRSMSDSGKSDSFARYADQAKKSIAASQLYVQKELRDGIKKKDTLAIERALLDKANPNESDKSGNTIVMQLLNQLEKCKSEKQKDQYNSIFNAVKTIIEHTKVSFDWNKVNKKGESIYSLVAKYKAVDNGALLSYVDSKMPAHALLVEGIRQENISMIKQALNSGANLNEADSNGNTAIMQVIQRMKNYMTNDGNDTYELECRKINTIAMVIVEAGKESIDWNKRNNDNERAWELISKYRDDNPHLFQYLSLKMPDPEEEARKNKIIETLDPKGKTCMATEEQARLWSQERIKQSNKEDAEREKLDGALAYVLEYPEMRDKKIQEFQQEVQELEQKPTSAYVKNTISEIKEKIAALRTVEQTALESTIYYESVRKLVKDAQNLEYDEQQRKSAAERLASIKDHLRQYMSKLTKEENQKLKLYEQWKSFLA